MIEIHLINARNINDWNRTDRTNTPVPFSRSLAIPLFDSFHNNHINFKSTTPSQSNGNSFFVFVVVDFLGFSNAFISSAPTMSATLAIKGRGYEMIGVECNYYNNVVISALRGGRSVGQNSVSS